MSLDHGLDHTHQAGARSWIDSANAPDTDFPIQNLPLGVARDPEKGRLGVVVAIGDELLDLSRAAEAGLLQWSAAPLRGDGRLNALLACSSRELTALRHEVFGLLEQGDPHENAIRSGAGVLRPQATTELVTPTRIGSFTDFYAGIYHARAASRILVSGGDVGSNYRWVPIAYQSRASTVRVSGAPVLRPAGQLPRADRPSYGPSGMLDFELELGFYVGTATSAGHPVPICDAAEHIAGFCLLNDWSARDIQRWEMAPLGPFLGKSFGTTISPWVVTADALRPFRVPAMDRAKSDPAPLPHLWDDRDQAAGSLGLELAVWLRTALMRKQGDARAALMRSDARHLYWTPAQMLSHHTSNGCDLQSGDLLGTGTISGPAPEQLGSLLELTDDGRHPSRLPNGESRGYLEDGDEVTLTARGVRDGFVSIGFGECSGCVVRAAGG